MPRRDLEGSGERDETTLHRLAPSARTDVEETIGGGATVREAWRDGDKAVRAVDPMAATAELRSAQRYRTRAVLGRGGMGEVRLSFDERVGRDIAIKVIRPELQEEADTVARFLREARVQGQLDHPSIVPVHDIGEEEDGSTYFTMKRVRGHTLEMVLEGLQKGDGPMEKRFTLRRILSAMVTVCLAVDFAHQRGIVHRDLKPANIMLGDFGEVYVLDWGIAKVASDPALSVDAEAATVVLEGRETPETQAGSVLGTPGFMAPEQVRGETADARSDVYAIGAILFEVAALEPLHLGTTYGAIATSTLRGGSGRPSLRCPDRGVPPEVDAICERATALDPRDRFPSARALSEAIDAYLEGAENVARRKDLAAEHARSAQEQLAAPAATAVAEVRGRRRALRHAAAALALDPLNFVARRSFVRVLEEPFRNPPPEALASFEREESKRARALTGMAFWAYASMVAYLPILLWMGIRSVPLISAVFGMILVNAAAFGWAARQRPLAEKQVLAVMFVNALTLASISVVGGPFFIVPGMAAVNVVPFLLFIRHSRALVLLVTCAAVVLPFLLMCMGYLPTTYDFEAGDLVMRSSALSFPAAPTLTLLLLSSLGTIMIAGMVVSRVKDRLVRVEQQLHVHKWQLAELLPRGMRDTGEGQVTS